MQFILEIKLLSATNPGSGEGWAGLIDSDIVFDELGIPFIPARRIKGILKEAALDVANAYQLSQINNSNIDENKVKALFGERKMDKVAKMTVGNAMLEDYPALCHWIRWAQHELKPLVTADRVTTVFTRLRQQTAIDEHGVALEGSLRITRVLKEDYCFYCPVELQEPAYKSILALAVQTMRYLGGKRNRGFGKIDCRLLDAETKNDITKQVLQEIKKTDFQEVTHG
ncbi:hypothetical protein JW964_06250 [candidate division KSB1 bacterium]|nr:hypothetical protein [candidate division KSB1 bacterium]